MIEVNWGTAVQIAISRIHNDEICGKCSFWMTKKCPKESLPLIAKPSGTGFICDKFERPK